MPQPAGFGQLRASAGEAARLLRALSNENRLLLLCLLFEGEKTVGELNRSLPLSQSALSQHLAVLREEGMVKTRRAGQSIYYGLDAPPARRVIETLHAIYCPDRC
ncbi:MAG TPA: metalloregulator ArsR/SmtB family transcription factor [Steroidobacteraceae bacterium]|nr:metalloregulator ArsR/SmtB family transcription factor [Steroidobacteraceae bacterium]